MMTVPAAWRGCREETTVGLGRLTAQALGPKAGEPRVLTLPLKPWLTTFPPLEPGNSAHPFVVVKDFVVTVGIYRQVYHYTLKLV